MSSETHDVFNQAPPLVDYDTFAADVPLQEAIARGGAADWAPAELHDLGARAGSEEARRWGEQANANPPQLRAFDRYGHRIDRVEYHPAYHELMRTAIAHGLTSAASGYRRGSTAHGPRNRPGRAI